MLVLRVPLQPCTGIDRFRKLTQGALACRQHVDSGVGTAEVARTNLRQPGVQLLQVVFILFQRGERQSVQYHKEGLCDRAISPASGGDFMQELGPCLVLAGRMYQRREARAPGAECLVEAGLQLYFFQQPRQGCRLFNREVSWVVCAQ